MREAIPGARRHADEDDESSGWVVQMCLWSLNPAVAFRSVSDAVRSVILASGTLSPLGSFATEVRAVLEPMSIWAVMRGERARGQTVRHLTGTDTWAIHGQCNGNGVTAALQSRGAQVAQLSLRCRVQLAAEFQVRFEAPHVINARTQVWAGSIAGGPDAQSLVATFEQSRKPVFQDSLGRSIAAIAGVVPDGLLVFFSSYSMMDRLKERWEVSSSIAC